MLNSLEKKEIDPRGWERWDAWREAIEQIRHSSNFQTKGGKDQPDHRSGNNFYFHVFSLCYEGGKRLIQSNTKYTKTTEHPAFIPMKDKSFHTFNMHHTLTDIHCERVCSLTPYNIPNTV